MKKIRKQIYLDPWQDSRLAELARRADVSEAEIVRKAIDAYLVAVDELPVGHPLSMLVGIGASAQGSVGGSDHDQVAIKS